MKLDIEKLIKVVGGLSSGGADQQYVTNVVIDSRKAKPGSLFVAFKGEQVDGHDFLDSCITQGCMVALVERDVVSPPGMVVIQVESTLVALQQLAAWQRRQFAGLNAVGITGSSGKTTTKELVASVFHQQYTVLKTQGNYNNEIGLPLTMFNIEQQHQWAILEMGMAAPGEIQQLAKIALPGIGIITNIGQAHIEFFDSQHGIAQAKFELAENLAPPRVLILNGDDPWLRRMAQQMPGAQKVIYYGFAEGNDITAVNVETHGAGSRFDILWSDSKVSATLNLPARHNISNALAAFAAGLVADVPMDKILQGLEQTRGEDRRLQTLEVRGMTIIDDSYNANPDSTLSALEFLGGLHPGQRKVAFLGDMLELGKLAEEKHYLLGEQAAANDVDLLIAVGKYANFIKQGAVAAGMNEPYIYTVADSDLALKVTGELKDKDVVLIKGSLGVEMDKIVRHLKDGGS